jgi:hypothetical protein
VAGLVPSGWPSTRPSSTYLTVDFLVLSPLTAVTFILMHQCLWSVYMGSSYFRLAQPMVRTFCARKDIETCSAGG